MTTVNTNAAVNRSDPRSTARSADGADGAAGSAGGRRAPFALVYAVLLGSVTAYSLLQSMIIPVLPTIQHGLHTSERAVTWVLTGYLLSATVFTPVLGRLGDIYGKEKLLVAVLGVLGAGCVVAGLANSLPLMVLARLVQGAGGAVMPLAFGILRDEAPPSRVAGAIGVTAAMTAVGGGFGIVLSGPLVKHLDWHWLFWLPLCLIIPSAVAVRVWLPRSGRADAHHPSVLSGLLLSGWLVGLLMAISEGPAWGWTDSRILGMFAATVVLAVLWVRAEERAGEPLVDMHMMRRRPVWTTNLVALLFGFSMYAAFAFLPQFVQTPRSAGYGFGASVTGSGLFLLPMTTAMFLMGLMTGRVANWFGSKVPVVTGSALTFAAMTLLTVRHGQAWGVYLATSIMGIGFGLAFSAMTNLIVDAVPPDQTGVASGMNANIRTVGGSIGSQLTATIITSGVGAGMLPRAVGYTRGFGFLAATAALATLASLIIPRPARPAWQVRLRGPVDHAELALVAGGTLTEGQ